VVDVELEVEGCGSLVDSASFEDFGAVKSSLSIGFEVFDSVDFFGAFHFCIISTPSKTCLFRSTEISSSSEAIRLAVVSWKEGTGCEVGLTGVGVDTTLHHLTV
jgi:hypothetical protein